MKVAEKERSTTGFDVEAVRKDFPILFETIHNKPLVYFDNGATAQKPQAVIDAIDEYYHTINSNVHRGVHYLSGKATDAYEAARKTVQQFINASSDKEIVFTKGTTESINLVAATYVRKYVKEGDEIILTTMEHHSNIVPWQMLCEEKKAVLKVIPVDDNGDLDLDAFDKLLSEKTRFISLTHVSNVTGTTNAVKEIIQKAHNLDIPVMLDGAQAVPHMKVDMQDLDVDFYSFSGHKVFGPMGIGVLYAKESFLDSMPPYQGGGGMIKSVSFDHTEYADVPFRFEAGTPNVEGAVGLAAALDYVTNIGLESIAAYEADLTTYGTELLESIEDIRLIGKAKNRASVISFLIGDIHPYDTGVILDQMGIAIRTGHHCCQPLMDRYSIEGTCRASLAFYNTKEELDRLAEGLKKVKKLV